MGKYNKYSKYSFARKSNPEDDGSSSGSAMETLEEALAKLERVRLEREEADSARRKSVTRSLLEGKQSLLKKETGLALAKPSAPQPPALLGSISEKDPIVYEILASLKTQDAKSIEFVKSTASDLLAKAESPMSDSLLNEAIRDYNEALDAGTAEPGDSYLSDFAQLAKNMNVSYRRELEGAVLREKADELDVVAPLIAKLKALQERLTKVRGDKRLLKESLLAPEENLQETEELKSSIQRSGKFPKVNSLVEEISALRSQIKDIKGLYADKIRSLEEEKEREAEAQGVLLGLLDDILFKEKIAREYEELSEFLEKNAPSIDELRNLRNIIYSSKTTTKAQIAAFNDLKADLINKLSEYGNLPEVMLDYIGDSITLSESISSTNELLKKLSSELGSLTNEKVSRLNELDRDIEDKRAALDSEFNSIIYELPMSELAEALSHGHEGGALYYSSVYVEIEKYRERGSLTAKEKKTKSAQLINLHNQEERLKNQEAALESEIKALRLEKKQELDKIIKKHTYDLGVAALEYAVKIVNSKTESGIYAKRAATDYESVIEILKDVDFEDKNAVLTALENPKLGFSKENITRVISERDIAKRYNLAVEIYKDVVKYSSLHPASSSTTGKEFIPNDFYSVIKASYEKEEDVKKAVPITYVFGEKAAGLQPGTASYIASISEGDKEGEEDRARLEDDGDWRQKIAAELQATQASLPEGFRTEFKVDAGKVTLGAKTLISDVEESEKAGALVSTREGYSVRLDYKEQIEFVVQAIPKLFSNAVALLEIDLARFNMSSEEREAAYDKVARAKLVTESAEINERLSQLIDIYIPYLGANELKFILGTLRKSLSPSEYGSVAEDINRMSRRAAAGLYPVILTTADNRADYLELFDTFEKDYTIAEKLKALDIFCRSVQFSRELVPGVSNFYDYLAKFAIIEKKGVRDAETAAEAQAAQILSRRSNEAYVLVVKACGLLKDKLAEYGDKAKSYLGSDPCRPVIDNMLALYDTAGAQVKIPKRLNVKTSNRCPLAEIIKRELSKYCKVEFSDQFVDVRLSPLSPPSSADPQKYLTKTISVLFEDSKELLDIVTYGLVSPFFWSVLRYGSGSGELNSNLYYGIKVNIDKYIENVFYGEVAQRGRAELGAKFEGVGGYLIARREGEPKLSAEERDKALRILMDRVILTNSRRIVPGTNIYNFVADLIVKEVIRDLYNNTYNLVRGTGGSGKNIKGAAKYRMIGELQNPDAVWEICYDQAFEALTSREDWTVNGEHPLKVRRHAIYKKNKEGEYENTGEEGGFEYYSSDTKSQAKASIIGYMNKYVLKELDRKARENIMVLTGGVAKEQKEPVTIRKGASSMTLPGEMAQTEITQQALKSRIFDHDFRQYFDEELGKVVYAPYCGDCYEILKRYVIFQKNGILPDLLPREIDGQLLDILDRYKYKGVTPEEQARSKNNLKRAIDDYEAAKVVSPTKSLIQTVDEEEIETELGSGKENIDYDAQVKHEQELRRIAEEQGSAAPEPETGLEVEDKLSKRLEEIKRRVASNPKYYPDSAEGRVSKFIFEKYWTPSELDSDKRLELEDIVEACRNEIGVEITKKFAEKAAAGFRKNLQAEIQDLYPGKYEVDDNGKLRIKRPGEPPADLVAPEDVRIYYKIDDPYADIIFGALYYASKDKKSTRTVFYDLSPILAAEFLVDTEILDVISSYILEHYEYLLDYISDNTVDYIDGKAVKKTRVEIARPKGLGSLQRAIREGQSIDPIPSDIREDYDYKVKTGKISEGHTEQYRGGLATYDGSTLIYYVVDIEDRLKSAITNMRADRRSISSQIKDISKRLQKALDSGDKRAIMGVLGTELESASGKNINIATVADLLYAIDVGESNIGESVYARRFTPKLMRSRRPYLEAAEELAAHLKKTAR